MLRHFVTEELEIEKLDEFLSEEGAVRNNTLFPLFFLV